MARLPFGFSYQYPYYNRYYNNYKYYNQNLKENVEKTSNKEDNENISSDSVQAKKDNTNNRFNTKISSKNNQLLHFYFNFNGFSDNDKPIIEILGIKLFLDDIIILGLLFILYQENVKDEMLFIILILLLLS